MDYKQADLSINHTAFEMTITTTRRQFTPFSEQTEQISGRVAVTRVPFERLEIAVPAFASLIPIPLSFSITRGILWGVAAVSIALLVIEHVH